MPGASPALLTCPRHVGRNRFAYYTRMFARLADIVVTGLAPAMLYVSRCLSCLDMGDKRSMVAFSLIRVCLGESSNRAVEHVFYAQVAADQCRVTGASMSTRERPSTESTILDKAFFTQRFKVHGLLHVTQLAKVEIDGAQACPSKKSAADSLHEPLPVDDSFAMICLCTRSEVSLEYRGTCFLELQKDWIVAATPNE